jgi:hypothetical protein
MGPRSYYSYGCRTDPMHHADPMDIAHGAMTGLHLGSAYPCQICGATKNHSLLGNLKSFYDFILCGSRQNLIAPSMSRLCAHRLGN